MTRTNQCIAFFLLGSLWLCSVAGFGQQVDNVPNAFEKLSSKPTTISLDNGVEVPAANGHFQGVQVIEKNGAEKLLISGSSRNTAYILQADLTTQKAEKLISLSEEPFRHAGGIQASVPYLVVGIEDNVIKTASKVGLYDYVGGKLLRAEPNMVVDRQGEVERYTAGATGLLAMKEGYLLVVGNWDSRHWDFYHVDPETGKQNNIASFTAPAAWAGYQSINLIGDIEAIYAIGTYQKGPEGYADLILVSKQEAFQPIMKKVATKVFNCANEVDFSGAAGLQVDKQGKLQLWAAQKNTGQKIAINRFSEQ